MGIRLENFFTRIGVFFAVVACTAIAPADLQSSAAEIEQQNTYTLQVNDAVAAADLVIATGGQVDAGVTIINVLEVKLTEEQLQLISASPLVVRISEGAAISVPDEAQVAGRFWLF